MNNGTGIGGDLSTALQHINYCKIITNLAKIVKKKTEPFNCHESRLWERFVTPILADSSAPIPNNAPRKPKTEWL